MQKHKEAWKALIAGALNAAAKEAGAEAGIPPAQIAAENPPSPEMGDIGFPMFAFAKTFRKAPPAIAQMVCEKLGASALAGESGAFEAQGPYVNVCLNRADVAKDVVAQILENAGGDFAFGRPGTMSGKRIVVEFSSPNTNKPLHLGHLRNDVLGESVSRILAACGADMRKLCIINDRGIHICKSMLAYKEHGQGRTPESEGTKSDHFVGEWYVRFSKDLKSETDELVKSGVKKEEAEARSPLMARTQEMLRQWEAGDPETVALWKTMNSWAIEGMKKTYARTGISFDKFDFESEIWLLGKEEVLKGLDRGIFYRREDGAIAVDLTDEKLDKKVLLRSDGTSIYITQDFGTAINRHNEWPFDKMIYVVGSEQQYHFKVLFVLLNKLGYAWAKDLYHLSYGMVNLPDGKMKSREGTVVDADNLVDSLRDMALAAIKEKEREEKVGDPAQVAEKVALGALHYYLLQTSPARDMLFDPVESLSFNGNTGPYLQYMGARISSLLRMSEVQAAGGDAGAADLSPLASDSEWELVKTLALYPQAISEAAEDLDPSRLAAYLYDLSKGFSRFYHDCPILGAGDPALSRARLELSRAVLRVLQDALNLICVPFLEVM